MPVLPHTGAFFETGMFLAGLAVVSVSSLVLSTSLERIGVRFGFTQALLGIATALGADAPEISSAIAAQHGGNNVLGVGIVFGSNLFNLASLLGLSAIVAGSVRIGINAAIWNGAVALVMTVGAALIALGALPGWSGLAILAGVFIPYVAICALGPNRLEWLSGFPRAKRYLQAALSEEHAEEPTDIQSTKAATTFDMLAAFPALVSIVMGSIGMVRGAQGLGKDFGVSDVIIGTIVLAALTGVPNALAALRLATKQRGAAVISEAFNSNSLNIAAGIFIPAWLTGISFSGRPAVISMFWLLGLSTIGAVLASRKGGVSRREGWVLVGAYAAFVVLLVSMRT